MSIAHPTPKNNNQAPPSSGTNQAAGRRARGPGGNRWRNKVRLESLTLATDYPTGPELAVASVTLGRSLTLRNLRLVRDSHGIPRVRYPARREGDRWLQLVEVIDRELGDEIRGTILLGFERYRDGMPAESEEGITW